MTIYAGVYQVAECAGTEVENQPLVGFEKIASGRAAGMHISAGSKDGQLHRPSPCLAIQL
jgi:hypothetical protein